MERRKILIATKTYPSISTKYKETVCTAGILLDETEKPIEWVRIYPIRFRGLTIDRRYKRWSIISAEIERNPKDFRLESYRINDDSIMIVREIDARNNWQERKSLILPLQFNSVSEIQAQGKSLGIIKPQTITQCFCKPTEREWNPKQQAVQAQGDLFEPSLDLEKIPYQFGYQFTESNGKCHKYSISDWEISELYRKCRDSSNGATLKAKEQDAIIKVKQKLEELAKKDLYFMVGNLQSRPQTFMTIGLFYPPIQTTNQLSLF